MAEHLSAITETLVEEQPAVTQASRIPFSSRRAYAQTFAASVAIRCLGVVSGVLAARLLGPTGRGELAVIIFLPMLLIPILELQLSLSLAYEVSKTDGIPARVIATGFWLSLVLGCLQMLVLAAVLPIFLPADKLYLIPTARWFVIYVPAVYVTLSLTGIDQGRGRFGRFSLFQSLPGAVYVAAILVAWAAGWLTPRVFAFGVLAGALVTSAVRVAMDGRAILHAKPDWTIAKRLLSCGFRFYLPPIAGYLLSRADMLLLVRLAHTEAIGLYAVAQAIAMGQIGAVTPFLQVSFAAVAGETDYEKALQTMARHFRLAQLAVIGAGLAAAALTPWGIRILFGTKFSSAIVATYLLIGTMVCWGLAQVLDQGLRAASHTRPGIFSNVLGLAVLAGLGIPGCIHYGINGLAAAMLAAEFVNLAVLIAFCTLSLKIPARSFWAFEAGTLSTLARALKSDWQNFDNSQNI